MFNAINFKMTIKAKSILVVLLATISLISSAQEKPEAPEIEYPISQYKPLILNISEDGSKYVRFLLWSQMWVEDFDINNGPGKNVRIRRARFLAYAQVSPRFLILTHFGLNNLNFSNADPIGNRATSDAFVNGPQIFLHDAWTEFRISNNDALYVGAGLHYWNGISRFTNASTLNFMTLDNYRQAWAQLGLSNQFGRHIGLYAKGALGKFQYSIALNDPIYYALGSADQEELAEGSITYSGRRVLGENSGNVVAGYAHYQFLDEESNKLPYKVGSYLGEKSVFNIGAGFFQHGDGTVKLENGEPVGQDVFHFAVDAFYDAPVGKGAINAYLVYYNFDYGEDYALGTTYGTGNSVYTQFGYLLPFTTNAGRLMPYAAFSAQNFEAYNNPGNLLQLGANWFIEGHNAKITLEYRSQLAPNSIDNAQRLNGLILQTHIFL
jgi:hypothetical protein